MALDLAVVSFVLGGVYGAPYYLALLPHIGPALSSLIG